ncbi:uncharacterized protein PGTG_05143 [Puccinia graminis f. sp. tritici CRL 75-36-700-3]|uniref:Homeobox domain-containing protein n=1 Tax=Puccinia graminis f. sp. tritici (strain CRL 75-36-700-3 / race SCCL) TaxID=418459 RepID=E3K6R8_PUCGT|nr:uncharacterized protein PGTG_05143 [Puccinia graminis f. sp. tritici CRL 75-36-700-3]EFP79918.2 hypothetical protein PGTG_05143 [Puccinia graminis f. sp. tritici CRL 75-36-700-3]
MVTAWWNATCAPAMKIRNLALKILPASLLDSFINQKNVDPIPPLRFPEVDDLVPQLLQLGLTPDYAQLLQHEFASTVKRVDESLSDSYQTDALKFLPNVDPNPRCSFVQALQDQLLAVRAQAVQRILTILQSRLDSFVQQSKAAQSTSEPSPSSPSASTSCDSPSSSDPSAHSGKAGIRPPKFTHKQTVVLNALLARDNQYSTEEKDLIAHELDMTPDQVNRWFCNARARKKPYSCPSRRPGPTGLLQSLSPGSSTRDSNMSPSPDPEPDEDTEMTIIATPSSSSSSSSSSSRSDQDQDEPMDAYFDFPAYQSPAQSWPAQSPPSTLTSVPAIPFDFDSLNHSSASCASSGDPGLWNTSLPQPVPFNFQPFAC